MSPIPPTTAPAGSITPMQAITPASVERPLRAGDRLTAKPRIADISARGPNEFLVVETTITDESGAVVCVGRSTLISRGTAG